jgi:hypothetical protein
LANNRIVKDIEKTGARGFALTGNKSHRRYFSKAKKLKKYFAFADLIKDNPIQKSKFGFSLNNLLT